MLKPGTKIEMNGSPAIEGFLAVLPEQAKIGRWYKDSGPRENMPGWHIVRFANGARLCVHESRFRVIAGVPG